MLGPHRYTLSVLASLLLVGAAITAWVFLQNDNTPPSAAEQALQTRASAAGAATYTDLAGNPIDLANYTGTVLVVNSWASWTPFSLTELPKLNQLAQDYSTNEVTVMAINRTETTEQVERILNKITAEMSNVVMVRDPNDVFYRSVGGYAMPETVVFDRAGEVIHHRRGPIRSFKDLHGIIDTALTE